MSYKIIDEGPEEIPQPLARYYRRRYRVIIGIIQDANERFNAPGKLLSILYHDILDKYIWLKERYNVLKHENKRLRKLLDDHKIKYDA